MADHSIDRRTSALLVMDFQTLIVDNYAAGAEALLGRTAKLITVAHQAMGRSWRRWFVVVPPGRGGRPPKTTALCGVRKGLANTEAIQQSRRERKKVEMRFAHMKRILGARPVPAAGPQWHQGRSAAHSNRAEPEAPRQTSLPCPAEKGIVVPVINSQTKLPVPRNKTAQPIL